MVLWKNTPQSYYVPNIVLLEVFGLVTSVTGDRSRAQPISESQLDEIRRRAAAVGVTVKALPSYDWEQIKRLAMRGECEISASKWALVDDEASQNRL